MLQWHSLACPAPNLGKDCGNSLKPLFRMGHGLSCASRLVSFNQLEAVWILTGGFPCALLGDWDSRVGLFGSAAPLLYEGLLLCVSGVLQPCLVIEH